MLELNLDPDEGTLRRFGFIALVAFGGVAGFLYAGSHNGSQTLGQAASPLAMGLAALGILSALLSLVAPRANRLLYVGLVLLTFPIGWIVSHMILVGLFFLIITPVALAQRMIGRDRLNRSYDPKATSYWERACPAPGKDAYFKQY